MGELSQETTLPESRSGPYRARRLWWARFRYSAKSQLKRLPLVGTTLARTWRLCKSPALRSKWQLIHLIASLRGTYARGVDVDRVCWVSPQRITYCSSREFSIYDFKGRVIGGDWDRLEKRFERLDICVALRQVCVEGKDWSETAFYRRVVDRLHGGEVLWGCRDKSDFDHRCKGLESLFETIRREGYKCQGELLMSQHINDPVQAMDEVTVSVGRHGDLLFSNCAHRLAVAKLHGIERIPVRIAVRHREWLRFREELLLYAKASGGKTYQPFTHPDLDDIPARHGCEERFKMIKESMSVKQGRLLDMGAKLGYYCHRFEDEGFDCYAVEDSQADLYFLRKLRRAENKKFKTIAGSVLECREIGNTHFDVVLALNILHQFLKTKESHDRFVELLNNLQTRELFFEPHLPDEPQMQDAYKNYTPDELIEFLLGNSSLERAECIGVAKDGGPLYKLY
jgi:hypothetical protein